jgi:hypothetical protein
VNAALISRVGYWICLLGTLVLAACAVWWRTFPNLEAISSPYFDALDFGKVQTLHPTLRWKPAETQGVTYDLVIWDSGLDPAKTLPQARSNWGDHHLPARGAW